MPVAIIAGTAIYTIPSIDMVEKNIRTAYGDVTVLLGRGENQDLVFLPRHGPQHTMPPHKVNYRANIQALVDLGVKHVLAAYAVGKFRPWGWWRLMIFLISLPIAKPLFSMAGIIR
jgi:purine nucleoside phosphorylase